MTEDDNLFVHLVNHGNVENGEYVFGFWESYPRKTGTFIANHLNTIPYRQRVIAVETCYSGALSYTMGLEGENTIIITQTNDSTDAWGTVPKYYKGVPEEWPEEDLHLLNTYDNAVDKLFNGALREALTHPELSDTDKDGKVSWGEVYMYAYNNDPYGPVLLEGAPNYIEYPELYDLDNVADSSYWISGLPGDANLDGRIDVVDLGILSTHWGLAGNWYAGDFNGDNIVNQEDLDILVASYDMEYDIYWTNGPQTLVPIPEPSTLILVLIGLPFLIRKII